MKKFGLLFLGLLNIVQVNASELKVYEVFKCKGIGANENVVTMNIDFKDTDKTNIQSDLGTYLFEQDYETKYFSHRINKTIYTNEFQSNDVTMNVKLEKIVYRVNFIQGYIKFLQDNGEEETVALDCESTTHVDQDPGSWCSPRSPRCWPACQYTALGCNG